MDHAAGSPIKTINRAIRRVTLVVIPCAIAYKVYSYYTYLEQGTAKQAAPGSFTGETVEAVQRKNEFEGAGDSYLGRKKGDRLQVKWW